MQDCYPKQVSADLFLGRLRGGSQPILVQASDGYLYVVKFQDNPQGPNLAFNEAMGSALYRMAGLRTPDWAAMQVSDSFLDRHPESWIWTGSQYHRPNSGWCFASRYQGMGEMPVREILARSDFSRVRNSQDFWKAWFLDILCEHCDHRQALFLRDETGALEPVFFDHGHMFGGPAGNLTPKVLASRYLDSRIYPIYDLESCNHDAAIIESLNRDRLHRIVANLPQEWVNSAAIGQFHQLLIRLTDSFLLANILDYLRNSSQEQRGELSGPRKTARAERFATTMLPACVPGVRYA